jgi:Holliday junction resolvase-like predicted endonuclease
MDKQLTLMTTARVRESEPGAETQLGLVKRVMLATERPLSLFELREEVCKLSTTGKLCSDAALSARLRDMRKLGFRVHGKPRDGGGTWEYWVSDPWATRLAREVAAAATDEWEPGGWTMNTNAKGARAERRAREALAARGFLVTRAAGSLGLWDLIALHENGAVLCVQVKCNRGPRAGERKAMVAFARRFARVTCEVWLYADRQKAPEVEVLI